MTTPTSLPTNPPSDPSSDPPSQTTTPVISPPTAASGRPSTTANEAHGAIVITEQSNIQNHPNASARQKQTRLGRRPKFTADDDLIIVREMAAARTHVAPNGETKESFEIASSRANATGKLSCSVTWKSTQDRYKRLQARFDRQEAQDAAMSGVGGEIGEMDELLSSMKEARDDKEKVAGEKRKAVKDKEAEKERLGAVIRDQAVNRRSARERGSDGKRTSQPTSYGGDSETPVKRRRKLGDALKSSFDRELHEFTEALARGDNERNRIDQERLALDRERFQAEKEEREKDRQERREEREKNSEMELQKFQAMLGLLGKGGARNAQLNMVPSKKSFGPAALVASLLGRLRCGLCASPLRSAPLGHDFYCALSAGFLFPGEVFFNTWRGAFEVLRCLVRVEAVAQICEE